MSFGAVAVSMNSFSNIVFSVFGQEGIEEFTLAELRRRFSVYVINRYRTPSQNWGTLCARIAKEAGLEPVPRPFDNLRASRSTEIEYLLHPRCCCFFSLSYAVVQVASLWKRCHSSAVS